MSKPSNESNLLNPPSYEYHFLGPIGAFAISVGVPIATYALYFGCNEVNQCLPALHQLREVDIVDFIGTLWDSRTTLYYIAWYTFCVLAWIVIPGPWVQGTVLRDGTRQSYKLNAFGTFILAMSLALVWICLYGPEDFTFIYRQFPQLITASYAWATLLAVYAYLASFRSGALLALGGNTGNTVYDFFIGRELNPQIGSLDIKSFNELRPGLILWALALLSMACEQAGRLGGYPTTSMLLVCSFEIFYIADAVYNEAAILTTMDITTDGCGFMLTLPIAWEPFGPYSLQARYLVFHPVALSYSQVLGIILVHATGYYIFRTANGEKNEFRNGRNPKKLQYITTESGSKLLVSGWWGFLRHPNYLGDLIMALSWSLPTGFNAPLTYTYIVYFFILLVHRNIRDDEVCAKKYGKDWEEYKRRVPYVIIPWVY